MRTATQLGGRFLGVGDQALDDVGRAGILAAVSEDLLFEDFARAVLFARDVGGDFNVRKRRVDFRPLLVRVGDELAVDDDFSGQSEVEILRLELQVGIAGVGRENDAVIADLDFLDFGDAGCLAGFELRVLDRARGVGDVDRVRAYALAEFLEAAAGAARLNDRGLEVRERFAEGFGNDLRIRQNRGGAGNLDLVAGSGSACEGDGCNQRCNSELKVFIRILPEWACVGALIFSPALAFAV